MNVDTATPQSSYYYPSADGSTEVNPSQVARARQLRNRIVTEQAASIRQSPSPIRAMARMVRDVTAALRQVGLDEDVIAQQVINRTIGDVDVRQIRDCEPGAAPGSLGDFRTLGDDLGLLLPGEVVNGRESAGRGYLAMRERMTEVERRLLCDHNFDVRMYDVYGVGNPVLRQALAASWQRLYDLPLTMERTFVNIGALDGLDKSIRSLKLHFTRKYGTSPAICFPAPGFAVMRWQAEASGVEVITYVTTEANRFKLTGPELSQLLADHPDLRILYLTVSNNPTAFDYEPAELHAIFRAIADAGREVVILADTAYIGTAEPEADRLRMSAFNTTVGDYDVLAHTIFINSFSKICTLTGDRFGWTSIGGQEYADVLQVTWNNTMAGLPAEWQLRYTATVELLAERPEIVEKVRRLYRHRRADLHRELADINAEYHVFDMIGLDDDATIYNWSKLSPGEDVISLFRKTGLAAVDGTGFGYDPQYVRCSVGIRPAAE